MFFINIGKDTYIRSSKVKAVIDANSKSAKKIKEKSEASDKFHNIVPRKSLKRSLIWMEDNTVYATFFSPETIVERLQENGKKLINVDQGMFISFDYIDVFSSFDSNLATKVRNLARKTSDDFNFIRQAIKKKVTIVLTTGETISVSLDAIELLNEISKFE